MQEEIEHKNTGKENSRMKNLPFSIMKAITKTAVEILKTKESHVIVVFEDNPKENWYLAGSPL